MLITAAIVSLADICGLYFHRNISLRIYYCHWNNNTFRAVYKQHMAEVQGTLLLMSTLSSFIY